MIRAGIVLLSRHGVAAIERVRDGRTYHVLPGGQVEDGELLHEALQRELREETGLAIAGAPRFLFVQEGERRRGPQRAHAWRSFFFACDARGDAAAGGEVLAVAWYRRAELPALLTAPYHDSFGVWLARGGAFFGSCWRD